METDMESHLPDGAGFVNGGLGGHFTVILNKALRDPLLSWRAKGILAGCLTHDRSFTFTKEWIIKHGTEGRDAVVSALAELRLLGYLKNIKKRDSSTGRVCGEYFVFTDQPIPAPLINEHFEPENATSGQPTGTLENRTPENQGPGKPASGKPGRLRRTIERTPIEEDQLKEPPISPPQQSLPGLLEGPCQWPQLPEWLEPYRKQISKWLENRKARHRLEPEITARGMNAFIYAREIGVLEGFCAYIAEESWKSVGFAGYKKTIDKIKDDLDGATKKKHEKPEMLPVKYTIR